jgi:hypothetical protein
MLNPMESFFVRLLRVTVILTALVSLATAAITLLYAGYAQYLPEPTAKLSGRVSQIRQAIDPANLIKELFPDDSSVTKTALANADNVAYSLRNASDAEIFTEFNRFLDVLFGGSFESQKQFSDWLHGSNRIYFSWNDSIDNNSAHNEDNVNVLWRSLLFDYAKRLSVRATVFADAKKRGLYSSSFDRLTEPNRPSSAPYFLVWFFNSLQTELQSASSDLTNRRAERAALRVTVQPALYIAAGAFGYFISIMFLFLFISIEASLRWTAETAGGPIVVDDLTQPRLDVTPDRMRAA